jgi:hypothetical protein
MKPSIDPAARAVEQVLDLMEREPFALDDFIARLEGAVVARAAEVRKHPAGASADRYDYWLEQARHTRCVA